MDNKQDKGTLAIKIVAITLIVLALIGAVLFMVFNKPKPHKDLDLSYAGKYELTEVTGLNDKNGKPVTPSSYEYNYIELGTDGRYEIANKYQNKKTSVKGIWYIEGETVHFEGSKMMGLMKTHDEGKIKDNQITMTIENDNTKIVMVLTKK